MPLPVRRFETTRIAPIRMEVAWRILSNTDQLNRNIGLKEVTYGEPQVDDEGLIYRPASSNLIGLKLRWREYPFQWEAEYRYSVRRVYEEGPLVSFDGGVDLSPAGAFCRITLFTDVVAANSVGDQLATMLLKQFYRRTFSYCELEGQRQENFNRNEPRSGSLNEKLLDAMSKRLFDAPVDGAYARTLVEFLRRASEDEISEIRPYAWARSRRLNRSEVLRVCLHAVKAGLLNLRWSLMCPHCRVSKRESTSLADVTNSVYCDVCGVSYDTNFDRYVELRFSPPPAIRQSQPNVFCLAGPFRTPHIVSQLQIEAGQTRELRLTELLDNLQLRVIRGNQILPLRRCSANKSRIKFDGEWALEDSIPTETGSVLVIQNDAPNSILIAVEKELWDPDAVTAAEVTALQEFRDLFSSEVLRPGQQISVENLTLLFTDLGNSTALYERIGDAPAYGRVGAHFEFLLRHVSAHRGALVKTMGDAIMAVFFSPEDAVTAAIQMLRDFPDFAGRHGDWDDVYLKVGVHHGPALAVNENERLDYFGRTVNLAARVVGAAVGPEIILTHEISDRVGVQDVLATCSTCQETFTVPLRGLTQDPRLVRVRLSNER